MGLISQFLSAIFGNSTGHLALKYGTAPFGQPRQFNKTTWFRFPDQLDQAEALSQQLASQGYDVGFIVSLFRTRKIDIHSALPAPFIYADDLPGSNPIQPHFLIRTSTQKPPQAIAMLNQPISAEERATLSRQWAETSGADPSGWDATQVLRLPDTRNYKYNPAPVVTLDSWNPGPWELPALRKLFDATPHRKAILSPSSERKNILRLAEEVAEKQINADDLLSLDGIPRRINPRMHSYRVWTASVAQAIELGGPQKRSGAFYQLVRGLLIAGYSDLEAITLATWHGAWGAEDNKPKTWLLEDACRIVLKLRAGTTYGSHPAQPRQASQPAARAIGRPVARVERFGTMISPGAAQLLDWMISESVGTACLSTRPEMASAIACTERMIRSYLVELEAAQLAHRHTVAGRMQIKIAVLGAEVNCLARPEERERNQQSAEPQLSRAAKEAVSRAEVNCLDHSNAIQENSPVSEPRSGETPKEAVSGAEVNSFGALKERARRSDQDTPPGLFPPALPGKSPAESSDAAGAIFDERPLTPAACSDPPPVGAGGCVLPGAGENQDLEGFRLTLGFESLAPRSGTGRGWGSWGSPRDWLTSHPEELAQWLRATAQYDMRPARQVEEPEFVAVQLQFDAGEVVLESAPRLPAALALALPVWADSATRRTYRMFLGLASRRRSLKQRVFFQHKAAELAREVWAAGPQLTPIEYLIGQVAHV